MAFPELSSAQRTALRAGGAHLWGLTVTFPSLTYRAAMNGFNAATVGAFQARVKQWSPIRYATTDRGGSLQAAEVTVTLNDYDRTLAHYCEGADRNSIIGSAATIRLMSQISSASWKTMFSGVVADRPRFNRDLMTAELVLRTDDAFLERQYPRSAWTINVSDFPRALPALWNTQAPILYGRHFSRGWTDYGMVPLLLIDTTNYYYLVTVGRAVAIENVYINKLLVSTSDWAYLSTANSMRGGKTYSLVSLTSTAYQVAYDAENSGSTWAGLTGAQQTEYIRSATVTGDVQGLETIGDGTGTLIENPMAQFAHFFTNFVLGDWRNGYWLTQSTRLDATTVTSMTTFFDNEIANGHRGARRISAPQSASSFLSEWLTTWQVWAKWTYAGAMAFGVLDPTDQSNVFPVRGADPSAATTVSINDAELEVLTDGDRQVRRSTIVNYVRDSSSDRYLSNVDSTEQATNSDAADSLDMAWGPAE